MRIDDAVPGVDGAVTSSPARFSAFLYSFLMFSSPRMNLKRKCLKGEKRLVMW